MKDGQKYIIIALLGVLLIVIAIFGILIFSPSNKKINNSLTSSETSQSASNNKFSAFDKQLAFKLMDKNHDEQCDDCGMTVDSCIKSGQLECNMNPKSTINVLGTQHIHADWKIYINGKLLDESFFKRLAKKSSFINVDNPINSTEQTGDVLHINADGVPLWLFFKSIGGDFTKNRLVIGKSKHYVSAANKQIKLYVNGKLNNEYGNYVVRDRDKILISYPGDQKDADRQLKSITNYAKDYK